MIWMTGGLGKTSFRERIRESGISNDINAIATAGIRKPCGRSELQMMPVSLSQLDYKKAETIEVDCPS
jgi:hypothetical protein